MPKDLRLLNDDADATSADAVYSAVAAALVRVSNRVAQNATKSVSKMAKCCRCDYLIIGLVAVCLAAIHLLLFDQNGINTRATYTF